MSADNYFGPGTTPERVAEAIERAQKDRDHRPSKRRATTSEREAFFGRIAEERKRAEGG